MRAIYDNCHTYKNQEREEGREKWAERGGERLRVCVCECECARGEERQTEKEKEQEGSQTTREQERWNEVWRETENNKDIARHTNR